MRIRKRDKRNLVKVGAFFSALTFIVMAMIASIGKENSFFNPKVQVRAWVENVSNLKPGSYVDFKGIRVGTVTDIRIISEDQVEIIMSILERELKWIKKDAVVSISTAGLVGDKFLEIHGGSRESTTIDPTEDILYSGGGTDMKKIISKGESIADVTNRILTKLDLIIYNLDDGQKIVTTMNSLQKTSLNLEIISRELKEANLGTMVRNVNKMSGSVDRIMTQIEKGPGTLNSLIYSDTVHEDLRVLLGGAQRNKVIKYFIRQSIKNSERKKDEED